MRSALFVLGVAALVACHDAPPPKTAATAGSPIGKRAFLLQSNEGADLLAGARTSLHFEGRNLGFTAECNHMGGEYRLEGKRLIVDGTFSTEMGCDARRHAQDEWLRTFFTSRPTLTLEGNTLRLASDNARLVFLDREVADPDRSLAGTLWQVNSYIDGDTAMGLMGIDGPRITFAFDGSWEARSACFEARGRYERTGERLSLFETRAQQGECVDNDKTAAEFVRSVMADGELSFAIDAGMLTLKAAGPRGLGASALSAP